MTPDVKGLLFGAARSEPAAPAGRQLGRRTADSPFAVLLASTATGRAEPRPPFAPGPPPAPGSTSAPATPPPLLDLATLATAAGPGGERTAPGRDAPTAGPVAISQEPRGRSGEHREAQAGVTPRLAPAPTPAQRPGQGTSPLPSTTPPALAADGTPPLQADLSGPSQASPQPLRLPPPLASLEVTPPTEARTADGSPSGTQGATASTPPPPAARDRRRQRGGAAASPGPAHVVPSRPAPAPATPAGPHGADGATPAPPSLTRSIGTPAADLEPGAPEPHVSEQEQEATESSLPSAPAPVPAPAGTGVIPLPPDRLASAPAQPSTPAPARGAAEQVGAGLMRPADSAQPASGAPRVTPSSSGQARTLHRLVDMGEGASTERHGPREAGDRPAPSAASSAADVARADEHLTPGGPSEHAAAPPALPGGPATPRVDQGGRAAAGRAVPAGAAPAPSAAPEAPAEAEAPTSPGQSSAAQGVRRDDQRAARPEAPQPRLAGAPRPTASRGDQPAGSPRATPLASPAPAPAQVMTRELGTSARMTQAASQGQGLRDAAPHRSTRPTQPAEPTPQAQAPVQAAPPSPEPAPRPASPARLAPAPPPEQPQTMVGGTILPHTAHLRLESEALGDLALHLRVRDGVAHVRLEGEQAAQVAGRGQELQRALAAEGLKLGQLEVERPAVPAAPTGHQPRSAADQGAPQGERERPERDDPGTGPRAAAAPARRPSGRATAHHVEA